MKRCATVHTALCVLGVAVVVLLTGCQDTGPGWANQARPYTVIYQDNTYIVTGDTVARVSPDADMPSKLMAVGSGSFSGTDNRTGCSVFLIRGVDENEAIAVKFVVSGGDYRYVKYERLYGQAEPAVFVYDGGDYKCTGEIVALEKVGGDAEESEAVEYLSSVAYQGTTYDVYAILSRGANQEIVAHDSSQEIAVKIAKAGNTVGFYSFYFKYERQ